jgi:hypothetical protein
VGENLGSKNWDVVACVRLSGDVEVLLSILRELLEEESEESVNVLSSCDGVANRSTTV